MDPEEPAEGHPGATTSPTAVARHVGRAGELVLRERDGEFEIISNGMFLMDTRGGRSERQLVRAALDARRGATGLRILIGGLGVGWSLAEALASPAVAEVTVLEWEPAIVAWNRTTTGARTGGRVDHPRVRCEVTDIVAWLQRPDDGRFDACCLDVDNGPGWTLSPGNEWLYGDEGIAALAAVLVAGGVLTVWSAAHDLDFEHRLRRRFRRVDRHEIPAPRGEPDVVYLAGHRATVRPRPPTIRR